MKSQLLKREATTALCSSSMLTEAKGYSRVKVLCIHKTVKARPEAPEPLSSQP